MKLLDGYIRNHVINSTVMVVLVVMSVEALLEFIGQLADIGTAHYTLYNAMVFAAMQLPFDLYKLFPMAGFLGCLLGLGKLASTSQLTVMRASGVSRNRIAWVVIKAAILMMILVILMGEFFAPPMQIYAQKMKSAKLSDIGNASLPQNLWFRNNTQFVHFGELINNNRATNILVFDIGADHQMRSSGFAKSAEYQNNVWRTGFLTQSIFYPEQIQVKTAPSSTLNIVYDPSESQVADEDADQLSVVNLAKSISYRYHAGLSTVQYQFNLWQRLTQPLTAIVMICLGVPFIFGSLRTAAMGSRVLLGVLVGFGFYVLSQFFGPLAMIYNMPPLLAAITPTLFFAALCVFLLRQAV